MKITKKYLQKVIKEELRKFLIEENEERALLDIYVDLHNALINKEKTKGRQLKLVGGAPSFEEQLHDIQKEKGMSPYDLYEELKNYQDKIDSNMYEMLRDALMNKVYEEDAEYIREPEKSDDEFDAEASDMYRKIYGKPDLRIVK